MRARTLGVLATIARSVAVFVAIVVGAAAIGALVGGLLWGEWLIVAGLAVLIGAWLASLPDESPEANGGGYYGYNDGGGSRGDGGVGGGVGGDGGII